MVRREGFGLPAYLAFAAATVFTLLVCVSLGSVKLPLRETFGLLWNALAGRGTGTGMSATIVFSVRLPRVLCVALTGASLSVCGAAMQGLLKNPLADGSTLGVSSGASLGAVISIAFGITLPGIPLAGTMSMAMLFAFLSLVVILGLAYRLDGSLSTGHANSTQDMLSRLETMVLQGSSGLPLEAIRQQIASALDIIIHLSRLRDKSRRTMEITEVVGYENGKILLNPLYVFEEDENSTLEKVSGSLKRTNNPMKNDFKLRISGYKTEI